jgi:ribosomal protein S18 acetylase RimI-like enzyme
LIENIAVDPRWRRLGVGTLLLNASAERAALAGCYRIHAVSSPENTAAHRMFRAAGYAVEAKGFRRYLKG